MTVDYLHVSNITNLATTNTSLAAETTARQGADTTLTTNLATTNTNLAAEATTRGTADTTLTTNLAKVADTSAATATLNSAVKLGTTTAGDLGAVFNGQSATVSALNVTGALTAGSVVANTGATLGGKTVATQEYADNAKSAAITAAAADATTKANTAQSNAIAAAATDATTKANAAVATNTTNVNAIIGLKNGQPAFSASNTINDKLNQVETSILSLQDSQGSKGFFQGLFQFFSGK